MKFFLRKTFTFLAAYLLIIVAISTLVLFLDNSYSKKISYVPASTLFLGDSHMEVTIDDKILFESENLGMNSESYYFTYFKLKKIIEKNPKIKTVYLASSYHNLSSYYDKFIDGEFSFSISKRYFFLLPYNEKFKMLYVNKNDFFSYLKVNLENGFSNICAENIIHEGKFANRFINTSAIEKSIVKRINFQFYEKGVERDFSQKNITNLLKINELCKTRRIKLILLNSPLHPSYKSKVPRKFIQKLNEISLENQIEILDLSSSLSNDSCFIPDGDHVSRKGALLTTQYIAGIHK